MLGTGTMGAPMARNLLGPASTCGCGTGRGRGPSRSRRDGATVADTPAEAARARASCSRCCRTVTPSRRRWATAARSRDGRAPSGSSRRTVGVEAAERFAALAERAGVGYVDAPVLGTKQPAEQGSSSCSPSGPGGAAGGARAASSTRSARRRSGSARRARGQPAQARRQPLAALVTEAAAEAIALARGARARPAAASSTRWRAARSTRLPAR